MKTRSRERGPDIRRKVTNFIARKGTKRGPDHNTYVLASEVTCGELMALQEKLEVSSDEEIDFQSFAITNTNEDVDSYANFNIPGDIFAKFEEINNSNLRAKLVDYDRQNDASVERRTISIWFCLPDCESNLNKKEHEWYRILLDTGASVSLISEGLFGLLQAGNIRVEAAAGGTGRTAGGGRISFLPIAVSFTVRLKQNVKLSFCRARIPFTLRARQIAYATFFKALRDLQRRG